jgi:hypothetical protein
MSGAADVMAIVMLAFFLVGVTVGIAVVYALSARKADKSRRRNRSEDDRSGEEAGDANRRGKFSLPV